MWDVLLSLPGEAGASGQAIVEKLLGEQGIVVAIEMDLEATAWMGDHPAGGRVIPARRGARDPRSRRRLGGGRPALRLGE